MKRILAFFAVFLVFPVGAEAASLYIDPAISTLNRGDSVTMSVRLDTDEQTGECVNAVDAVITYSDNVEPVDVSIGGSIFKIWVEEPKINREDRTVTFAGGIPNGYCGRVIGDPRLTNTLAQIVFRSPGFRIGAANDDPQAHIDFSDQSTAYLNDGFGTKAALGLYGAKIELNNQIGSSLQNDWQAAVAADNIPPEAFTIELVGERTEFGGRYYIVFNTTDKQTGIDQYQVIEEPSSQFGTFQWGRADAPWTVTRSPHVLNDQSLNSIIRVKAIDKAGNEYIATLIPDESMRSISQSRILFIVLCVAGVVMLLVVLFVGWRIWRKLQTKRQARAEVAGTDAMAESEVEYEEEVADELG
ncbi:hypothetical protein KC906_01515, partial [Candidatus Kaiserbacteria bacterium]|nr:hypothetical protein [Candidatus Kaiserbacteria bacterium]